MLPIALEIAPGVQSNKTALQAERGIFTSALIRHKNGLIQKLGGCQKLFTGTISGIARALFPWADLEGNPYLAVGTNQRLQLFFNGQLYDITPIVLTDNISPSFSTIAHSSIVTVTDGSASPVVGNFVEVVNLTYIGGLLLQGIYPITAIGVGGAFSFDCGQAASATAGPGGAVLAFTTTSPSNIVAVALGAYAFSNGQEITVAISTAVGGVTLAGSYPVTVSAGPTYTIDAGAGATSDATASENGGDTRLSYLLGLPSETESAAPYGSGLYGEGPYGYGESPSGITQLVRWSLDKWGEDLVAGFAGGTLYEWIPPVALGNVAEPVMNAPSVLNGFMTAAPEQQVMAWGIFSSTLGEQDPLLVGWCDVDNLTDWTATATNQAGTFRLSSGSLIVGGLWIGLSGLLWTDLDLWIATYQGFPFVYGFSRLAPNCGLIAPRAAAILGTVIAWMSANDFFLFAGGSVGPIICTVRDFVFNNLDRSNTQAIFAAGNTYFGEIAWWFPTIGSNGACNAFVKFNIAENLWDLYGFGMLELSAWADQSVLGAPIGAFQSGFIEQFETAADFDGQVLPSGFTSGWFELAEGEEFLFLERILPDFVLSGSGQIQITLSLADDMAAVQNGLTRTYGPYVVTSATPYFVVRGRGRLCQIQLNCVAANTFWRYGKPLAVVQPDGRR